MPNPIPLGAVCTCFRSGTSDGKIRFRFTARDPDCRVHNLAHPDDPYVCYWSREPINGGSVVDYFYLYPPTVYTIFGIPPGSKE